MRIQIKCRISGLKINNARGKSIDVSICDELRVCNTVGGWGVDIGSQQPVFFPSKKLTIENANLFFDFISAHARETFLITIEKMTKKEHKNAVLSEKDTTGNLAIGKEKGNGVETNAENNGDSVNEEEERNVSVIMFENELYKVVEVELIYG